MTLQTRLRFVLVSPARLTPHALLHTHMPLFELVTDLRRQSKALRGRRYGVIETRSAELVGVRLRPWPKLLSWPEIMPVGPRYHPRGPADTCRLFYNQPLAHPNFLAVKYVATTHGTSLATVRAALSVLDVIAEIKRIDALLCDVSNTRISDRLLARCGWSPHAKQWLHRNFIKRFYGAYPRSTAGPAAEVGKSPGTGCTSPTLVDVQQ